jgi:3-methyladenine DNA glycosylase AlkC
MGTLKATFDATLARDYAERLSAVYPALDVDSFVGHIANRVEGLELKGRVGLFAAVLRDHLPFAYGDALDVLLAALPPELDDDGSGEGVGEHFEVWPVAHFVEVYGLADFERSMAALHAITKRFSAEFAIRPYLQQYPDATLAVLRKWTRDPNHHVRRLCSEGTRPRLPWATHLKALREDPTPVLPILEALKNDPTPYVRRSVANHLNDITKDHPKVALDVLRRWNIEPDEGVRWITRHALRGMIKAGDVEALTLLGYLPPQVALFGLGVSPRAITMGESVTLGFSLQSTTDDPQELIIDYVMHFVKANGSTAPKVFKLTTRTLKPGETLEIEKTHTFKPITTRTYYSGEHRVEVQVNGRRLGAACFQLTV